MQHGGVQRSTSCGQGANRQHSLQKSAGFCRHLPRVQLGSLGVSTKDADKWAGIFLHTCVAGTGRDSILMARSGICAAARITLDSLYCLRCNRELEPGHKSVAVYMFANTVGIRPRQKSTSQRICFCPQCSVSLAMGPPPEGALNLAAWQMIRDLVSADPALNQAAWDTLRGVVGLLPATGTDGPRRTNSGGYFEF